MVTSSTTELIYGNSRCNEKSYMAKGLISDLGVQQNVSLVFSDSYNALYLTNNQMFQERTT